MSIQSMEYNIDSLKNFHVRSYHLGNCLGVSSRPGPAAVDAVRHFGELVSDSVGDVSSAGSARVCSNNHTTVKLNSHDSCL